MKVSQKVTYRLGALALVAIAFLTGCEDPSRDTSETTYTTTVNPVTQVSTTVGATTNYYMTAGGQLITTTSAGQFFATAGTLPNQVTPANYMQMLFHAPYNPLLQFYIPKYSYFQGLCYSAGNLQMLGQVRVIGAAMNEGTSNQILVAQGGMVTTDPDYIQQQMQPSQPRYTVLSWQEVP